ncbi:ATP-dependent nuclease [Desulfovibrio oxyclinae]|uniref:ATP-dependent nuclease n=1 Tax=Desulfovibrio oxyclinae TaxID=63560 RepID=UPI00037E5150|nr:AAA family ATPase [Desulfovibrio oxyclinae]
MHISHVSIRNYRNFKQLDISLANKAVIMGENSVGKTNFLRALRLILDPTLPDSARHLTEDDFWDGLDSPISNHKTIEIAILIEGFEGNPKLMALLSDYVVSPKKPHQAKITYKFKPVAGSVPGEDAEYEFNIYGGLNEENTFGHYQRKFMPLQILPALRDAEGDLKYWNRSPLRPLIESLALTHKELIPVATGIDSAQKELGKLAGVQELSERIGTRLKQIVGELHSISPSLGVASTETTHLLRSLKLYVDGINKRSVGEASLGLCNLIYLVLLSLELERKELAGERATTILAIEEPEAHLHPHLQRLVFKDFFDKKTTIILTTHSPNIVSIAPIKSYAILRDSNGGTKGYSSAQSELSEYELNDLARYMDTNRGELLFSRGIIFVEGAAEEYLTTPFAKWRGIDLDQKGISVCSINGTHFEPYIKLVSEKNLNIPYVVITDGDPVDNNRKTINAGLSRGINIVNKALGEDTKHLEAQYERGYLKEVRVKLQDYNIFVGIHTLEIDLCKNAQDEMYKALESLGAGTTTLKRFEERIADTSLDGLPSYDNRAYILNRIEDYGKGLFAQRLASILDDDYSPEYFDLAIDRIDDLVTPN